MAITVPRARLLLGFLIVFCIGICAADEQAVGDHVRVTWLAPESFGKTSSTTIGLHFEVDEHWHVYWRNAGDSGAAPKFQFAGDGLAIADVQWPAPTRLPVEHLTNFGYEGDVAYPFELRLAPGTEKVNLVADLEWLVCKIECLPGFGLMTLSRPVRGAEDVWAPATRQRLATYIEQVPQPPSLLPVTLTAAEWDAEASQLRLRVRDVAIASEPEFFPLDGEFISARAPVLERQGDALSAVFQTLPVNQPPATTEFVLRIGATAWRTPPLPVSRAVTADSGLDGTPNPRAQAGAKLSLPLLVLLAFVGGMILNLMPCVLPVLSIKLLHLFNSGAGVAARRREGLYYAAGVLVSFAALGGAFILLRAAGLAVGWGFQLQSPWVVLSLMVLFWCLGLGFLGLLQFGDGVMRWAGAHQGNSSLLTGVLAVLVAAPCTGPFMGAALGAATLIDPLAAMLLFLALGAGLAAPITLAAFWPGLAALLPRPGEWMNRLKEFFAFPMFATVIWLAWVLASQLGERVWVFGGILLLALSLAVWALRLARIARVFTVAGALLVMALAVKPMMAGGPSTPETGESPSQWQAFAPERIDSARARGRNVFIDFTAAWCITCQVNKHRVLTTPEAENLFARHDTLLLRADWTRYDPVITEALAEFERNSVPLYVLYPGDGGEPKTLPQILTLSALEEVLR